MRYGTNIVCVLYFFAYLSLVRISVWVRCTVAAMLQRCVEPKVPALTRNYNPYNVGTPQVYIIIIIIYSYIVLQHRADALVFAREVKNRYTHVYNTRI